MISFRPDSPSNRFRAHRFQVLKSMIETVVSNTGGCRIIDLGGTAAYWNTFGSELPWDKIEVSLLNLTGVESGNRQLKALIGDARDVSSFGDNSFDIVFSNSVIEHVGRWRDMVMMAREVRRLAPQYLVQTPYFWFPIEPHARFPFLHWMPEPLRYRILLSRACGYWEKKQDVGSAMQCIQSATLLDKKQMRYLFPDATIVSERFLGLTKSLSAIRRSSR